MVGEDIATSILNLNCSWKWSASRSWRFTPWESGWETDLVLKLWKGEQISFR